MATAVKAAEQDAALIERMKSIKHVILVLSGKGGVGKSTMTVQLGLSLAACGNAVGLLDIDLCGPSLPKMLHLEGHHVHQCSDGWVPVHVGLTLKEKKDVEEEEDETKNDMKVCAMSIGFLLDSADDPVVWRGPKKIAMIKQFLSDVAWGPLDYLLIDTPPGTSDEHISVVEYLRASKPDGAIVVTTPQGVALSDVRKELNFCRKAYLPILGLIENMSGFTCPTCSECTNVFSTGGGESLAKDFGVPFLGRVPLDPTLSSCEDRGENFLTAYPKSVTKGAVDNILKALQQENK